MPEREYILYCDESVAEGPYYSNFYGGVLIGGSVIETVTRQIEQTKHRLHLHNEVKWQRVTDQYLTKYLELMDYFFDQVQADRVKVRIMFRQNARKPTQLTDRQVKQSFYRLYYQFIKHGFGFRYMPKAIPTTRLRIYFDQFPDTGEQVANFRGFILGLNASTSFRNAGLILAEENLTEVRSHEHPLLQCLDIVLGAMAFRLNDMHKAKPPGQYRRGRRTVAKEKLYKHLLQRIRRLHPNFNIGITTGGGPQARWSMPYRHWAFVPRDHEYDTSLTKHP